MNNKSSASKALCLLAVAVLASVVFANPASAESAVNSDPKCFGVWETQGDGFSCTGAFKHYGHFCVGRREASGYCTGITTGSSHDAESGITITEVEDGITINAKWGWLLVYEQCFGRRAQSGDDWSCFGVFSGGNLICVGEYNGKTCKGVQKPPSNANVDLGGPTLTAPASSSFDSRPSQTCTGRQSGSGNSQYDNGWTYLCRGVYQEHGGYTCVGEWGDPKGDEPGKCQGVQYDPNVFGSASAAQGFRGLADCIGIQYQNTCYGIQTVPMPESNSATSYRTLVNCTGRETQGGSDYWCTGVYEADDNRYVCVGQYQEHKYSPDGCTGLILWKP